MLGTVRRLAVNSNRAKKVHERILLRRGKSMGEDLETLVVLLNSV